MLSGGNALEAVANRRARRALTALLERAPTDARRRGPSGELQVVAVEELAVGDVVVVRPGEVVPVDGTLTSGVAVLDESALTGEPLPALHRTGEVLRSGTANAGEAFELRADRPASESTYAGIVRLVRDAEQQRAPFVRMADRYAIVMLVATLVLAGAGWIVSGEAVRAVAVLVVATPCPLILAAPVALISGVARAARVGVIVKGGGVIEQLAAARTVLLDKTGTLTRGQPELERVVALDGLADDDVLRLAASVEQYSLHVIAQAIVRAAAARGLPLAEPANVREAPGEGVDGEVEGRRVVVGGAALRRRARRAHRRPRAPGPAPWGEACILVGVDGALAGTLVLGDRVRPDAGRPGRAPARRWRAPGRDGLGRSAAPSPRPSAWSSASTPCTRTRRRRTSSASSAPPRGPGAAARGHGRRRRQRRAGPRRWPTSASRSARAARTVASRDRRRGDRGRSRRSGRRRHRDQPRAPCASPARASSRASR